MNLISNTTFVEMILISSKLFVTFGFILSPSTIKFNCLKVLQGVVTKLHTSSPINSSYKFHNKTKLIFITKVHVTSCSFNHFYTC